MSIQAEAREACRIILFCVAAAVAYGILHDQVTAHLCVEYFTIAHMAVFPTESPFWLAVGWGILATWWVGGILGVGLALAARAGRAPRLTLAEVKWSVMVLMTVSGGAALLSGIVGAVLFAHGVWALPEPWDQWIPREKHLSFAAAASAHEASYAVGFVGGVVVIARAILRRRRAVSRG